MTENDSLQRGCRFAHRQFTLRPRILGRRTLRRGHMVLVFAVFLTFCVAMLALAIDMGMVQSIQTDLQRSADSGALAGARELVSGGDNAVTVATQFAQLNDAGTHHLDNAEVQVQVGHWDKVARIFDPGNSPLDAVRVTSQRRDAPFFFGRVFGRNTYTTQNSAIAIAQPRDIMLVLDISGSMADFDKMNQLKRAVQLFCAELLRQNGGDRVGVAVYSTSGSLLSSMSPDIAQVNSLIQGLNPDGMTNISEGMRIGRTELQSHARPGAANLMVLLTDGLVNQPVDAATGRPLVTDEAQRAADIKLPVVTISFSEQADPTLMQEVADITHTVHFHVAGDVTSQEADLKAVFLKVASKRPVQLVE